MNLTKEKIALKRSKVAPEHSLDIKAPSQINWTKFDTPVKDQVKYEYLNFNNAKLILAK